MPTCIFGEAVHDQLSALLDRLLPQWPQKRIVDSNGGFLVSWKRHVTRRADGFNVNQGICWIGRAFQIHQRDFAALFLCHSFCAVQDGIDFVAGCACRKIHKAYAEARQYARDQGFGCGI